MGWGRYCGYKIVIEGFTEKLTFEHSFLRGVEASQVGIWGKAVPAWADRVKRPEKAAGSETPREPVWLEQSVGENGRRWGDGGGGTGPMGVRSTTVGASAFILSKLESSRRRLRGGVTWFLCLEQAVGKQEREWEEHLDPIAAIQVRQVAAGLGRWQQ